MDVGDWLRGLGLGRYEQAFRDNEIDPGLLPNLTADDLKDLGVSLVGHRRRLLDAIAALKAPERKEPTTDAKSPPAPTPGSTAERRQLTVLFVDLVGSTALSADLDPEDMGQVIGAYHACCADVVERWAGHVAKYMGDGVLVYFGWPQAHEDDAERAVRAGLELVAAVGRLGEPRAKANAGPSAASDRRVTLGSTRRSTRPTLPSLDDQRPLAARVGIATGLVMVGELIGEGAAQEQAVVGDTPNLAARLQALAAPGQVVISQATRRLLGRLFELDDLGPQRLKGFAEPLTAFRVAGEGRAEGRFEALRGHRVTPLVGREHELAMLLERWRRAKDGDGQVVLLAGEPGIGKSRLIRALREALSGEPHIALSHFCSPHHINSALHPIIAQLERAAGFGVGDEPATRLAKLEVLLAQATDQSDEAASLFAALLGIPTDDRYPTPNLSPQRQKQRTLEVLIEQLEGLARDHPVLELYEDVHWIDPSTLELLDLLVERVRSIPALVVLTYRPEFSPPWTGRSHVTTLPLNRLGRREGATLAERVTSGKALPAAVLEQIVAKTDGVPLFVEELTKTVLESDLLADRGDRYELTRPLPPLAIPATLHDSLMVRLDRHGPIKEVAQTAAVIGREFSHALLAAVSPLPEGQLDAALDQLVASELIFRRGTPPDATYAFKHALVQDAAYQSLLKSKRQQLHARIADVLEKRFVENSESEPEVLARHLTEGRLAERAIPYWRRAGELAVERAANREAIAHLSKGLELLETLPNAAEQLDEELALRLAIGGPLTADKGYAAPEVQQTYSRAWALCDQLGQSAELFPVFRGLWNYHLERGELLKAHDLAQRLVALADEQGVPLWRALARRARGTTLVHLGRFSDATRDLNDGIAIDDAVGDWDNPTHFLPYTERAGVVCRLYSAWTLWHLGFPDQAVETMAAALALSRRLPHLLGVAFALTFAASLHNLRREFDAARSRAEAAIEIAREHDLSPWLADAIMYRGCALVGLGRYMEGIAQLRSGVAAWNAASGRWFDTQWLSFLADAHLQAGQLQDAVATLNRAADVAAATGECHYQTELYRLRGIVLANMGEHDEAAPWLQRAIDIARSQRAKSLELRAATSLARLWTDQDRRTAARNLLAPIYAWFTEGFDTADLKDAKALLDELS